MPLLIHNGPAERTVPQELAAAAFPERAKPSGVEFVREVASRCTSTFLMRDDGVLHVQVKTPRLVLESVSLNDVDDYYEHLFGDPEVKATFEDGKPESKEQVQGRLVDWALAWRAGDPFSAFAIRQPDDGSFVGHIELVWGERHGEADLAYLIRKNCWRQGYAREAAAAVVYHLAPLLRAYHRWPSNEVMDRPTPGPEFKGIEATALDHNRGSVGILNSLLMNPRGTIERAFGPRQLFKLPWPTTSPEASWEILCLPELEGSACSV